MPQTATSTITHIVAAGETLSLIAQKYYGNMMNYPTIANANGIKAPFTIQIGQRLKIPNVPADAYHQPEVEELSVGAQRLPPPATAGLPAKVPSIASQMPAWTQDWRVWLGGALIVGGLLWWLTSGKRR